MKNYDFHGKDFAEKSQPTIINVIGHSLQILTIGDMTDSFIHSVIGYLLKIHHVRSTYELIYRYRYITYHRHTFHLKFWVGT